jgi:RNA-directed DNA polymerase
MIVDNDSGSTGLFKHLGAILGKSIIGGMDPFYHAFANLYVVPVPKAGVAAAIEDLFDPALLGRKLDGKEFDRSGKKKDLSKWYDKFDFATKIVKTERATINFVRFEPLLKAISDVRNDFATRGVVVARAA